MVRSIYDMEQTMIPLIEDQLKDVRKYPLIGRYLKALLNESEERAAQLNQYLKVFKSDSRQLTSRVESG